MSDTKRSVQVGWGPGNPAFDKWNASWPPKEQTKTVKHQTRDRDQGESSASKKWRFAKGVRNTRHSLERKVDALKLKEELGLSTPGITCKLCKELCNADQAHLHQGEWIGDECCWDERLRASE